MSHSGSINWKLVLKACDFIHIYSVLIFLLCGILQIILRAQLIESIEPYLTYELMRRITVAGLGVTMLINQPYAWRVFLAGITLTRRPYRRISDFMPHSSSPLLPFVPRKTNNILFIPREGLYTWARCRFPNSKGFTLINASSGQIIAFLLQTVLYSTISWPAEPMVSDLSYIIIQFSAIVMALKSTCRLNYLSRKRLY